MTAASPALDRDAGRLENGLFAACGLSWAAAIIHAQAIGWHLGEYAPFAALFAVLAAAQIGWGVLLYRRPHPRLLWAGVVLSLGVVAVWIVSRTSGLPLGPERWSPEEVGSADVISSADEVAVALLAGLHLVSPHRLRPLRVATLGGAVFLASLSSLTFMLHAH